MPVPLNYGVRRFQTILSEYLAKGYRYFWLDFEGSATPSKAPYIRSFHDCVDTECLGEEVVLYGSNIRRENNPHLQNPRCPASDFLTAPLGVDIIGVNREPQRGGGGDLNTRRPYVPPSAAEVHGTNDYLPEFLAGKKLILKIGEEPKYFPDFL